MAKAQLRTPPGMRDFAPAEKRRREWVINRIRKIFERYGYDPIETPSVELFETLQGKLGEEGEQLLFKILRRGTSIDDLRTGKASSVTVESFADVVDSALRFDLTVPFARFLAMHSDLPRPFKRYQIQPVWRAERQQRGRYREFYQCDVDVAGTDSMMADAEIIAIVVECLRDLGFTEFQTIIGHRKLLDGLVEVVGGQEFATDICTAIDKFDKIGRDGVEEELRRREVPAEMAARVLETITTEGTTEEILDFAERAFENTQNGPCGVAETRELFGILAALGVPKENLRLDLRLVRGLDYYTGPVFESVVTTPAIGSLSGGGRYDNLIGKFTGQPVPAVGTSVGVERIIEVMKEFEMFPDMVGGTQVLVTVFAPESREASIQLASTLRAAGIACEIDLRRKKGLKQQITYASNKGIPLIAVLGPDEIAEGTVTLRTGPKDQRQVPLAEAAAQVQRFLEELGRG